MDRKRKSDRIERWLNEINDLDRQAAPIDFADVVALSQHACLNDKCPLRSPLPLEATAFCLDPHVASNRVSSSLHASVAPHISGALEPQMRVAKQHTASASDSAPTTGSSSSSDSMDFTSTESNTELKQSSASSLASSLDSNKMKVVRREQQQVQQQPQVQQHQQQQQQQQQRRSRPSCHGASGDNRVEATAGHHHPAGAGSPHQPRQQQQQLLLHLQSPPPPPPPLTQEQHHIQQQQQQQPPSASPISDSAGRPSVGLEAGVIYYFHICGASASPTARGGSSGGGASRERRQQLLALMQSLRETDPALLQIAASHCVTISLGHSVEPIGSSSHQGACRRKVVIQGANWRGVMDAVNDISLAFPELMSPVQPATPNAAVSGTGRRSSDQQHLHKQQIPPPSHTSRTQDRAVASPGGSKVVDHSKSQHLQHQQRQKQHLQQQQQQQHLHQQKHMHQSASSSRAGAISSGAGQSQSHCQQQQQQQQQDLQEPVGAQASQPKSSCKSKLAQNVRFQLTTQQRESLFTQDEAGRPTHPRLKHLLSMLRMDLVFLERSINQENVPSVKVRFFFDSFDQLTGFCKAIDYQIPSQS